MGRDLDTRQRMLPRQVLPRQVLPRQVLPRQFSLITRRCAHRQFLLRPDAAMNNAFLYCLIAAALRSQIGTLLPWAMSNHYDAIF
jgi:putative transposase